MVCFDLQLLPLPFGVCHISCTYVVKGEMFIIRGQLFLRPDFLLHLEHSSSLKKKPHTNKCKISGFRLDINVLCALLGFYTA